MKSQYFQTTLALIIVALAFSACGPSEEELAATSAAETAAAATSTPTSTPTVTSTPTPTPTSTPIPTATTLPYGRAINPLRNPANGHFYEAVIVSGGINWFDARVAAEMRTFEGVHGHLATITTPQEDSFIARTFPWAVAHRGPAGDITVAYWLGGFQTPGSNEWQWITGEPFVYTNWAPGEPNQFQGNEEDCLQPHPDHGPLWNDSACDRLWGGYVIEYDFD